VGLERKGSKEIIHFMITNYKPSNKSTQVDHKEDKEWQAWQRDAILLAVLKVESTQDTTTTSKVLPAASTKVLPTGGRNKKQADYIPSDTIASKCESVRS
jgi:hypothetical protein